MGGFGGLRPCPICGKSFLIQASGWAWRSHVGGGRFKNYCSYTCMRKEEKSVETHKALRTEVCRVNTRVNKHIPKKIASMEQVIAETEELLNTKPVQYKKMIEGLGFKRAKLEEYKVEFEEAKARLKELKEMGYYPKGERRDEVSNVSAG